MTNEGAAELVARWRVGDQEAAAEVFRRYTTRLVQLVRQHMVKKLAGRIDPEDVVQSVYRSFFAAARNDRFDLAHGGDLWRLLVAITLHKLNDQVKRHTSAKRSVARERSFSTDDSLNGLQALQRQQAPSPLEAAALAEQLEAVMRRLKPQSRRVLELRLEGHDLETIASRIERSQRSVIRTLNEIRSLLEQWGWTTNDT